MQIEMGRLEDAVQLAELYSEWADESLEAESFVTGMMHADVVKVVQGGKIVAAAWLDTIFDAMWNRKVGRISNVFVKPEFRCQGIAELMMKELIEMAKQRGAEFVELTTSEENVRARGMYEKLGFSKGIAYWLDW